MYIFIGDTVDLGGEKERGDRKGKRENERKDSKELKLSEEYEWKIRGK